MIHLKASIQTSVYLSIYISVLISGYFLFGIHSDLVDDSYRSAWWSKIFSKHQIDDFFVFYAGPLKYIYLLYNKYPHFQWSFVLNLLVAGVACTAFIFSLSSYLQYKRSDILLNILVVFSVSLFLFIPNLLHFSMLRISSLVQVISLMGLMIIFLTPSLPFRKFVFALLIICYLIGTLLRTQVVPVFLFFAILFILLTYNFKFKKIKLISMFIGLGLVQLFFTSINQHPDKKAYYTVDALVTQLNDFYVQPEAVIITDVKDITRIEAVNNWFFTDKKQITDEFSRKYIVGLVEIFRFGWKHRSQKLIMATDMIKVYYSIYRSAVWFYIVTLLFCFALYISGNDWRIVCFNLLSLIFLISLGLFVKFELRHLTCINVLLVLLNLFYLFEVNFLQHNRSIAIPLYFTLSLFGLPAINKAMSDFSGERESEEIYFEQYRNVISNLSEQHLVVLDLPAMLNYTICHPTKVLDASKVNNVICYDSGYGTFYSQIRNEWDSIAGGHGADDLFRYLATHKNVIWIGNPERLLFICKYMHDLYQIDVVFSSDLKLNFLQPAKKMGMAINIESYRLISVNKSNYAISYPSLEKSGRSIKKMTLPELTKKGIIENQH